MGATPPQRSRRPRPDRRQPGPGRVLRPDLDPGHAGPGGLDAPPGPGSAGQAAGRVVHRRVVLGHRVRRAGHRAARPRHRPRPVPRYRHPPRWRPGGPAGRGEVPGPPVRRRHVRRHRTLRPGHLQRAEAGKRAERRRGAAVRHRRADRRGGDQPDHRPGPPRQAGRGRVVPAAGQAESLARTARARPGRVEHRQAALRVRRPAVPPPRPGQSRPGRRQNPPGPGPGPRPGSGADLHLASCRQSRDRRHHQPAERRPRRLPAAPG